MAIYVTGDTHGERGRIVWLDSNEEKLTKDDFVIVCGDFGYLYYNNSEENVFLNEIEERPYTLCFVDGNHENFPAIFSYPEEEWNGGKIHRVRKNVIHLMRGQVFTIEGKKIFTMGGAYSIDREMRRLGISYWEEELPSDAEYKEASKNLEKVNNEVDVVLTHTAPKEIIYRMMKNPAREEIELSGFLEWVRYDIKFKQWFFGHWHTDKQVTDKIRALYFDLVKL